MGRAALVMLAMLLGACDAQSLAPDAGGPVCLGCGPDPLLSDFEDLAAATIVQTGTPPRNGTWYTYNDGAATCAQAPTPGGSYVGEAPRTGAPGTAGSLALHGLWTGCDTWGAGIGADLFVPVTADGSAYTGPKVPYDLSAYTGVVFWAMATPGTGTQLRIKFPMTADTAFADGGACNESASVKCGDSWGEEFSLPTSGNWKQVTVRFGDSFFQQQGGGTPFAWNAGDVTSIQIQSVDKDAAYDFWIDDLYLLR